MQNQGDKDTRTERRKYKRVYAAFVEYSCIGEDTLKEIASFTEDVSAGGICILASEEKEKDTLLSLKIYLPDRKDPIEAKGKVVWTRPSSFLKTKEKKHYDLGIEFVEIDEEDRKSILKYASRHSEKGRKF